MLSAIRKCIMATLIASCISTTLLIVLVLLPRDTRRTWRPANIVVISDRKGRWLVIPTDRSIFHGFSMLISRNATMRVYYKREVRRATPVVPWEWGFDVLGIRGGRFGSSSGNVFYRISVPLWGVLVVFSGFTLAVFAQNMRNRNRVFRNECPICTYNLTGNVSGTCPECGVPVRSDRRADA